MFSLDTTPRLHETRHIVLMLLVIEILRDLIYQK